MLGPRRLERDELQTRRAAATTPSGDAVDRRAAAAPRDPLLAVAEVEDVAERDVAHGRPVGDRDGERVERQAALGVEAAVDRVDHDAPAAAAAEAALADLLGDHREALTALGHAAASTREGRVLGGLVDRDRRVAARAAPELVGPPRARHAATAATTASRIARQTSSQSLGGHGSNGVELVEDHAVEDLREEERRLRRHRLVGLGDGLDVGDGRRGHEQGDGGARRLGGDERGRVVGAAAVGDAVGRRDGGRVEPQQVASSTSVSTATHVERAMAPARRAGARAAAGAPLAAHEPERAHAARRRDDAALERVDVGDLLELPALGQQRSGRRSQQLGSHAADDAVRREEHRAPGRGGWRGRRARSRRPRSSGGSPSAARRSSR